MQANWRLRPHDPDRIAALSLATGLPSLVAHLLLNRGVTTADQARVFMDARRTSIHDPELLPGAVEAADRLVAAVRAGRKIVVYGDYDVDGVCGATVLSSCLKLAGSKNVQVYIPHRVDEGYGVNAEALRRLATEHGASLVVTVDCGITAVAEARLARELGLELIITDHHTPGPVLPEADVIVHPRRPGGSYPFGELCGCGVAFKVAWQVCKSFGDGKKASPHLKDFLVRAMNLVALATVADVVPLEDENRIFVRHGLAGLNSDQSVGVRALLAVAGLAGKPKLSAGQIGYNLAPRINAAGRLEAAMTAYELLTTEDDDRAKFLAGELDRCNRERQDTERRTLDEARAIIEGTGGLGERGALVLARAGWHPGVVGIVAGRLAEMYHRPAIVLAIDEEQALASGSARSVPGFNLHAALCACSEGLTAFGGHAAAAGLKMPVSLVPEFIERFDLHCRGALTTEQREKTLTIDAEVRLGELTIGVIEQIDRLEPYGQSNPAPMLMISGARVAAEPSIFGSDRRHLRLKLNQGPLTRNAIFWGQASRAEELGIGTIVSAAFAPEVHEWNDRREVRLVIKDLRVEKPAAVAVAGV
jgi:single-stranded-DNA-specific exonuclease